MAIKGKKKSQKRGSQGARRPAAPPRPAVARKNTLPWYKNPRVIAALGTLAIILIGVLVWQISSNADEAKKLERQQEALDDYTDQMRGIVQNLRAPAQSMAAAPPTIEDEAAAEQLATDAEGWAKDFETALADIGKIVPSDQGSITHAHNLYNQAIQIYLTAAQALQLAADTEGDAQQQALSLSSTQRAEATAVWTEATAILDEDRSAAELDPSGVTAPDTPAAGGAPGTAPGEIPPGEIPTDIPLPEDGGETDGGQGDGGGQGGNGGGQGNGNGQ